MFLCHLYYCDLNGNEFIVQASGEYLALLMPHHLSIGIIVVQNYIPPASEEARNWE